jgi:argonaute-like protein implicated in RNA metabolism and viral defense
MRHVITFEINSENFQLRFGNGKGITPVNIVRYGPFGTSSYSPTPNEYKTILILHEDNNKVKVLAERFMNNFKEGLRAPYNAIFPGFKNVFDLEIDFSLASFKRYDEYYDEDEIYETFSSHCEDVNRCFPVIILPRTNKGDYRSIYYRVKAMFLKNQIPTQIFTIDLLKDEKNYKWSLLPTAVQIYAKMGGIPYVLAKPRYYSTLKDYSVYIMGLGISQHPLHKNRGVGFVTVFDDQGIWQFMNAKNLIMDKDEDMSERLAKLLDETIDELLKRSKSKNNVLIMHYSGKEISHREEEAIRRAVREKAKKLNKFAAVYVLKIRKHSDMVVWENQENEVKVYPPVGAVFQLKRDVYLLVTSGCFDEKKSKCNIRRGLSRPIIVSRHRDIEPEDINKERLGLTDRDLLATVFGMCRLNYNSIQNPVLREPITTRYSREIAWLLLRAYDLKVELNLDRIRNVMWFI